MKRIIAMASVSMFTVLGCGPTGSGPVADCSAPIVLSEAEISTNGGVLPAESCWLVESSFTLDRPLTVEEGVVIEFAAGTSLVVDKEGSLTVEGSEEKPVYFTGTEKTEGFWHGLKINTKSSSNTLDHIVLEYAGSKGFHGGSYSKGAFFVEGGKVVVKNSTFQKNTGAAFMFFGTSEFTFENNTVSENEIPGRITQELVGQLADTNKWEGNTEPSVLVGFGSNTVSTAQTWAKIGTSLKLMERMSIQTDLTLTPGLEIIAAEGVGITVEKDGSLNAKGTTDEKIVFGAGDETKGFWKGISFLSNNTNNVFDFVSISYAGGEKWHGGADSAAALYLRDSSRLLITNSEILSSSSLAFLADESSIMEGFSKNLIKDNAKALRINAPQMAQLAADSTYSNNDEDVITIPGSIISLKATWKNSAIPFRVVGGIVINKAVLIDPGTTLEFGEKGLIRVESDGSLKAEGSESSVITFKGASPTPGYWQGLQFNSGDAENQLTHVLITDAGKGKWNGGADTEGNIYVTGKLGITDSKVTKGAGFGIVISGGEVTSCTNVDLSGNAKGTQNIQSGHGTSACP